jgi:putative transposase
MTARHSPLLTLESGQSGLGIYISQRDVVEFCLDALEMALAGGRKPEIFHSDRGRQFNSSDFVARLQAEGIKISWSGKERCYDNILVERLWRTVK